MKVVLIEEGEDFPDIIGLSLPDIAKITAEKLSNKVKKFLEAESERGINIEVPEVFFLFSKIALFRHIQILLMSVQKLFSVSY
jgi:hypothetical protein